MAYSDEESGVSSTIPSERLVYIAFIIAFLSDPYFYSMILTIY